MTLTVAPCRALCSWSATGPGGLFACAGCGSQWLPSQGWTPRQADGTVPAAVRAARLSAGSAGAAGSVGS